MATTEEQPGTVELQLDDTAGQNDVDSALGDDRSSLTQSLRSSLLESVQENGRGYHRYKSTSGAEWLVPEDDIEQDRLDLQHEMWLFTFDGKLHNSPLGKNVKDVLDVGTGTGIWAIDYADEHPNAQVIGTDLSAIQPQYVPPNCKFEIDDFNSEWTFSQKFDFIHARGLCATTKDWPAFMRQAYKALKPGGWLEMPDLYLPFRDIDGSMKGTKFEEFTNRQFDGCAKLGIDGAAASKYKQWMIEAGFEKVKELDYKWPIGTWPKDKKAKYLGKMTMINMLSGLEGFTLRLWTSVLGIPYEQVLLDMAEVRKDIANPKIHAYWQMYTAFGQKPESAS